VPGTDSTKFISFLTTKLLLSWASGATIEKINNGKTIRAYTSTHEVSLVSYTPGGENRYINILIDGIQSDRRCSREEKTVNGVKSNHIYFNPTEDEVLAALKSAYNAVHASDANHPVYMNHFRNLTPYQDMGDILSWDTYTIKSNLNDSSNPVAPNRLLRENCVYAWEMKSREGPLGGHDVSWFSKPVITHIQFNTVTGQWGALVPTVPELRATYFAAVCLGCAGVGFWSYSSTSAEGYKSATLVSGMNALAGDVKSLNDMLVSKTVDAGYFGHPGGTVSFGTKYSKQIFGKPTTNFDWMVKQNYLIIVNKDHRTITSTISVGGMTELNAIRLAKLGVTAKTIPVTISGGKGTFTDSFAGYGVHIYQIGTVPVPTKYKCSGSPEYACELALDGIYDTLAQCQATCQAPAKWKCSGAPDFLCAQAADGTYDTKAECELACQAPITNQTVTYSVGAGNGMISVDDGAGVTSGSVTKAKGSTVKFQALPGNGYRFVKWFWGNNPNDQENPKVWIMDSSINVLVIFEQIPPAVLGSITVYPATQAIVTGQEVDYTAMCLDTNGLPLGGVPVVFTAEPLGIVSINPVAIGSFSDGKAKTVIKGVTTGLATIKASSGIAPNVISGTGVLDVNIPVTKYKCNGAGVCLEDPTGPYDSLAACQAACQPPVITPPDDSVAQSVFVAAVAAALSGFMG
jgi:hypothetical protein